MSSVRPIQHDLRCQTLGDEMTTTTVYVLVDPSTGSAATLPKGAVVTRISMWLKSIGDRTARISDNGSVQVGVNIGNANNLGRFISRHNVIDTFILNQGLGQEFEIHDSPLEADAELRAFLGNGVVYGQLVFELKYLFVV